MAVEYLTPDRITDIKTTAIPHGGITVYGYSVRRGAPTCTLIKIDGKGGWRRVRVLCFSNASSTIVTYHGRTLFIVDLPESV